MWLTSAGVLMREHRLPYRRIIDRQGVGACDEAEQAG